MSNEKLLKVIKLVETEAANSPARILLAELRENQYLLDLQNGQLIESQFEIERSRDLYVNLFDYSPVGMVTLDSRGIIKNINLTCADLLGYQRRFITGTFFINYLDKSSFQDYMNHLNDCLSGKMSSVEVFLKSKSGEELILKLYSSMVMDPVSNQKTIQCTVIDNTEQNRKDLEIRKTLKEKMILLKEVHHRVKNNLQIISSLLNLQAEYIKDERIGEILQISRNRVKSMALIDERLYKTNNLSEINISEYINDLVDGLFRTYEYTANKIQLRINVENALINIDTAVSMGLIVNELVTNCIKHAFKTKANGLIEIELQNVPNGKHKLTIKDNGIGIPHGFETEDSETFGLQLVTSLVSQIHGDLSLNRTSGTEFSITF